MALGKRGNRQEPLFISHSELPRSAGHPFYRALNQLLAEAKFDAQVEKMCASAYSEGVGRPSIAPGIYFRMLLVGYFEGIDSQRGIAWRCNDSLSLREFLGVGVTGKVPDHSSLTIIRQRLSAEIHETVFTIVLSIARTKKLLDGKTLGVDATLLEANAAMKSIVRKDSGENWKAYLRRMAEEENIKDPSDDDLKRFDQNRKGGKKSVSNAEWQSTTDPDSRIARDKDGRTHLSYKAEHAVDLESNIVVAATIQPANRTDTESFSITISQAQGMLEAIEHDVAIEEIVADKGYYTNAALTACAAQGLRTYVPVKKQTFERRWRDKPPEVKRAVYANDRRVRGARGRRLLRRRSERVERSFAHVCETGGARRSWLRGLADVMKRYLIVVAAHNLGRILLKLFGIGKPRGLQGRLAAFAARVLAILSLFWSRAVLVTRAINFPVVASPPPSNLVAVA